jgi:hypothetical protein
MHEEVVGFQPAEDAVVPYEIMDGHGAADTEEDADDLDVFVGIARGILEVAEVLAEILTIPKDVTFHGESTVRGSVIDGENRP